MKEEWVVTDSSYMAAWRLQWPGCPVEKWLDWAC